MIQIFADILIHSVQKYIKYMTIGIEEDISNSQILLFALKGMEDFSIPSIYGMIIFFAFTLYIFYKLFFKKYDENYKEKNCILIFHIFNIFGFKIFIYLFEFVIIKDGIIIERPNDILIACLSFKYYLAYIVFIISI